MLLALLVEVPRLLHGLGGGEPPEAGVRGGERLQSLLGLGLLLEGLGIPLVERLLAVGLVLLQLTLQLLLAHLQSSQFLPSLGLGLPSLGGVLQGAAHLPQLSLQLGDEPGGAVGLAAVAPVFQGAHGGGVGDLLLSGGGQSGNAPLQIRGGGDGGVPLAHQGAADKHLPAHPREGLSHVGGGEEGHRVPGGGVHRLKAPKGAGAVGKAAQGDALPLPLQPEFPRHDGPRPGLIPRLLGQVPRLVPLPGVDAVEHGGEEGRPGGFSTFVGGGEDVEPGGEGEGGPLQLAEGGGHGDDVHARMSSSPSRAASPKRVAKMSRACSSGGATRIFSDMVRRKRPVSESSPARCHSCLGRVVASVTST